MPESTLHPAAAAVVARYRERTKRSIEHDLEAQKYLPGGDTRSRSYVLPHPPYMVRGQGARLFDVDGHIYLDMLNNYTSLIHGHVHPPTMDAVRAQLERGSILGAPEEIQYRHAAYMTRRVPSLERLRYCNSGTEATMYALRAARAFTGRMGVVKMDGGYHGAHETVEVNITPDLTGQRPPLAKSEYGVPDSILQDVFVAPFNDSEALAQLLDQRGSEIAAVILEPVLGAGGLVKPRAGYLAELRDLTRRHGVLLVFDEIITLRLHYSGYQGLADVRPDLTALGKIIGGGFPVGAFGGREDIMAVFDPHREKYLPHSGTFNGAAVVLAAGLATLEALNQEDIDRLNNLGKRLQAGFDRVFLDLGVSGWADGCGSLVGLRWGDRRPTTAREAALSMIASDEISKYIHLEMLNQGIYAASRGWFILSTPMGEAEIDQTVEAFRRALTGLKPLISDCHPEYLKG
ncbi:MAG: aspartate aminotransferase family protein [Thermodesulfobacteriota bacterium]